jgi:hypothetical protein
VYNSVNAAFLLWGGKDPLTMGYFDNVENYFIKSIKVYIEGELWVSREL